MLNLMVKSKIHRATVTDGNLNYNGSITVDETLMKAANLRPFEFVHVNNLSNAAHWETYVIPGKQGECAEGACCIQCKRGAHCNTSIRLNLKRLQQPPIFVKCRKSRIVRPTPLFFVFEPHWGGHVARSNGGDRELARTKGRVGRANALNKCRVNSKCFGCTGYIRVEFSYMMHIV